jgi:hypothetical protein
MMSKLRVEYFAKLRDGDSLVMIGDQGKQRRGIDYRPCVYCKCHPNFPDILPVTLHFGAKCAICDRVAIGKDELRLLSQSHCAAKFFKSQCPGIYDGN